MSTSVRPDQAQPAARRLSSNTASVSVAKPPGTGLGDWMSQLRDWLDQHGIEPAGFKQHDGASDSQTYEVSFHRRSEADLFAAAFNKKHLR